MGISLLLVNVDSYRGFNPARSYTENNYQTNQNNKVTKTEFGWTEDGQKVGWFKSGLQNKKHWWLENGKRNTAYLKGHKCY